MGINLQKEQKISLEKESRVLNRLLMCLEWGLSAVGEGSKAGSPDKISVKYK